MEISNERRLRALNSVKEHEASDAWEFAVDDVNDNFLAPKEGVKARDKELQYIKQKGLRFREQRQWWIIIQTRWIDVNKGDTQSQKYRSQFVGKEFNNGVQQGFLLPNDR